MSSTGLKAIVWLRLIITLQDDVDGLEIAAPGSHASLGVSVARNDILFLINYTFHTSHYTLLSLCLGSNGNLLDAGQVAHVYHLDKHACFCLFIGNDNRFSVRIF